MADAGTREIYSLLAPMSEGRMLLPRASVAEVVGALGVEPEEGMPSWFLGTIEWNETRIPLVSFEGACGWEMNRNAGRSRVLVVLGLTGRLDPPYYALLIQGHPHLVRVNQHVLLADELRMGEEALPLLARVRMANEKPVIPDLERLEEMLADALGRPEADGEPTQVELEAPGEESFGTLVEDEEAEFGSDDLIAADYDDIEEPGEATVNDLRGFKLGSDDLELPDDEDDDGLS